MSSQIKNQIQLYHRLIHHRDGYILEYSELETLTFDTLYPSNFTEQPAEHSFLSFELIFVLFLLVMLPIFVFIAYHYGKKMGQKETNPPPTETSNSPGLMLQHGISNKSTKATLSESSDGEKEAYAQLDNKSPVVTAIQEINYNQIAANVELFEEQSPSTGIIKMKSNKGISAKSREAGNEISESDSHSEALETELKVEFVLQRSSKMDEANGINDNIYTENLKLHTDDSQIEKQEVKFGLIVENRDGVLQKIETKEIRTTYIAGAEEPEKNANLVKNTYEVYRQNPTSKNLFIPLPSEKEEPVQSRSLVPFNTPQVIRGDVDLARQFVFPSKNEDTVVSIMKPDSLLSVASPSQDELQISRILEREDFPHETGKFAKIFKNVEHIGEGSFGEVYRVVHKLDGKNYAVKKVKLRLGQFQDIQKRSKVFREVFAMTDLHHPNIVRYSTCWVEIDHDKHPKAIDTNQKKTYKSHPEPKSITEESEVKSSQMESESSKSSCVGFEWDANEKSNNNRESVSEYDDSIKSEALRKAPGSFAKSLSNTVLEDCVDNTLSASNFSKTEGSDYLNGYKLYLYIQMEYCAGQNLRNHLDNPEKKVDQEKLLQMFKKLLEGVDAIHKRGILHRDLKPANIFFDGNDNVKIGDFGLASLEHIEESPAASLTKKSSLGLERSHSMRIGTPMYTSPEQENGGRYNHKTDIYSMGLIFYEMLENFSTHHQRYQLFNLIRRNHEVSSKFRERFPLESELILKMTAHLPENRPDVEDLVAQINKIIEKTTSDISRNEIKPYE